MIVKGLKRKALLLSLVEKMNENNSWSGETHIQKVVFFLQKALKVPMEYEFILYKHGPFSFELRDELTEMITNDLIGLNVRYPYGPSYIPGVLANTLKELFPKTIEQYSNSFNLVAKRISKYRVSELEKIATALYVNLDKGIENEQECADRVHQLKPHIPLNDAMKAAEKVKELLKDFKKD